MFNVAAEEWASICSNGVVVLHELIEGQSAGPAKPRPKVRHIVVINCLLLNSSEVVYLAFDNIWLLEKMQLERVA
jgi:hypothetical protein